MNLRKTLKILKSSVLAGIIALITIFLFLTVITLPFYGIGSFLLPVYFWGYIVLITPLAMIIGGIIGFNEEFAANKEKERVTTSPLKLFLQLGLYVILLLSIVFLPFVGY